MKSKYQIKGDFMWLLLSPNSLLWTLTPTQEGISPLPERLGAVKSMPSPQNMEDLRQFLGHIGYYRNHIN